MEKFELTNDQLNKILIEDYGKRKFIKEMGRVPLMMRFLVKRSLPLPKNIKELNALYKQGKYEEAYNILKKLRLTSSQAKWYIDCVLIILCYFRLDKPDEAKELIEGLNYVTFNLPQIIMTIASKVGAKYVPGNMAITAD